ncbi:LPP20 family lipoprotein [Bowmanella denitrificans]|uniref:LPP20 family lipoprotein n=1 Tax=Bowmanella denitrificans TaxID=366582 RepID=A0ABN0XLE0_9ALTE|nr:LPP20 family lipoprotein [Bowmanella denitrificans]
MRILGYGLLMILLGGCSSLYDKQVEWEYIEPATYPVLQAVGYAPIAEQQGSSDTLKMLQAIKASKLDAYRELAEQVYGQRLSGQESLSNLVLSNAQLKSSVDGVIRGAKVVKSYAVDDNTYATELELDMRKVHDIYLAVAKPKRVKKVRYY